ncbi:hypothetical protein SAMN05192566_0290 [Methylophilus rhizosphaerae]|uniref:Uncharacterized protein n=1 Tax=Methylophilus rhizosphaerae TaxID=492660 RepID=A0A1G8ZG83_9PROT|nr:hypothetical protein [Methylophilus rhizosphaerae]SDK14027.1 hypothetical protein SAMN05192566_0290 [Methylophilus rhizosphaerae]
MKSVTIKLAVLGALSFISMQSMATGLVAIPTTGFTSSAYTSCNTTGNFGSSIPTLPTTTANNTCAVFPTSESADPTGAGYTLAASKTRSATINGVTVGYVLDRVWRNAAKTSCIFGARFTAYDADWDPDTAGTQYFEVNDIARAGFGSLSVNAGYYIQATNASPVYRIGRTFTSVQHRAYKYDTATNKALLGTNYLDLPTKNSVTSNLSGEATGINATTVASTSSTTQDAVVNSNWIDFTLDSGYLDDDGGTNVNSAMTYVEAACDDSAISGWEKAGAIRLRQTGQEATTMQEITLDLGYAPPGATVP